MIISRRFNIKKPYSYTDLLGHIERELRKITGGDILRYAIVDVKKRAFVVDVSFVK
ncbi:MAG: hypothetical protein ACP5H8_00170 [Candidatus Micrarchaeia archaeon]